MVGTWEMAYLLETEDPFVVGIIDQRDILSEITRGKREMKKLAFITAEDLKYALNIQGRPTLFYPHNIVKEDEGTLEVFVKL